jgi:DNA end-binding protein Ku
VAPRASWKGFIKVAELAFPVALVAAAATSERMAFHTVNRATGNRVRREFVDEETEKPVEREAQVKGYEIGKGEYVVLEPEEIESAIPESNKTIRIEGFIACPDIDKVYFDRPYFLTPASSVGNEAFAVLREGMRKKQAAALGRAVLFRRVRTLLLRAQGPGLVAHTLNFDYEIRPAEKIFDDIGELKVEGEMLDLAKYIIKSKSGTFDPRQFDDRYEAALAELVKAKIAGREFKAPKPPKETKVVDLMDALRKSAQASGGGAPAKAKPKASKKSRAAPATRRKAS